MRKLVSMVAAVSAGVLVFAGSALAVTVPDLSPAVSEYGDTILDNLVDAFSTVFPYAAAFTVIGIVIGVMKRWIGKRKATNIA